MKQPALMISNYLFWKESQTQTHLKWLQEGAMVLVTWTQSLYGIINNVAGLFRAYPFGRANAFVDKVSC